MAESELSPKTERKIRSKRESVVTFHLSLNREEGEAFERERERLGLSTKASLGRMLIRQGLGLSNG